MGVGVIMLVLGLLFLFIGIDMYGESAGDIFVLIVGVIFSIIGGWGIYNVSRNNEIIEKVNNPDRQNEAFTNWIMENLSEYQVTFDDLRYLNTGGSYYIFNPEVMKFISISYSVEYDMKNKKVLDYFDHIVVDLKKVRKISLKTDNQTIGEITKGNAIGRAVVGGVLFGGAGAIVGSASAKETQVQSKQITSIKMEIITSDVDNPYSTIPLYDIKNSATTNFEQMEHAIQNLYWSLENSLQSAEVN